MNKKGFTLIELLAVIIILGILMIIAIPSVTRYISDSRKAAYIDTAKQVANATKNLVNSGKLEMYDTSVAYYIPNTCIKVENGNKAKSPYGEFVDDKTYVVVTYDGKGYSYYWVSLDDTGTGVKEPISIDKLSEDNIESDLKKSDVKDNIGLGKESVVIFNPTCDGRIDKDAFFSPICKRATKLHKETCERNDSFGCNYNNLYSEGDVITYGNLGTIGTLSVGDAFDCDVNGDGIYDDETERFYYVSDYYNTITRTFDNNYAVLSFYTFVSNGEPNNTDEFLYSTNNRNYLGPNKMYLELPDKSKWKNVSLVNNSRQILTFIGTNTTENGTIELPIFDYINKSSRLLTYNELYKNCHSDVGASGVLRFCTFLLENTAFHNSSFINKSYIETVYPAFATSGIYIDGSSVYPQSSNVKYSGGVRPIIEVPISKIEY